MFKQRYKIKSQEKKGLIQKFTSMLGIPEIYHEYVLYFKHQNQNYPELVVKINSKKITYSFLGGKSMLSKPDL